MGQNSHILVVKFLATVCIWATATASAEPLEGARVKYVKIYDMNFVVALARVDRYKPRVFNVFCSGALITPKLVLTSEHCFRRKIPENVVVYAGSHSLNDAAEYSISKWISYRDWINNEVPEPSDQGIHDLGIAKLSKSVDPQVTRPGSISWVTYDQIEELSFKMIGWGTVENGFASEYMREAKVKIYGQEKCQRKTRLRSVANHKVFCTYAQPHVLAGDGDSGGPLLDGEGKIAGITFGTWLVPKDIQSSINLHVNVAFYRDFITSIMREY